VNNNANSNDCNGHGTHCAGTVGSKDYGVCKHCRLIAVKVLDCGGSGSWSSVINGINWVINQTQSTGIPSVVSMSLGGGYSAIVNNAVANAVSAGIVTVVAAGNENSDACGRSPASTPSAITVGAISKTNTRSSYSNFGSCLDIYAPGDDIVSTWIGSNTALNTISGTSMATPHVAGVAAVYRSYNPSKTATEVRNFLVDQISTLNVISNLDANSPNRVLYSQIENLNQTDRTLAPTVAPTRSPTLPPTTLSPTTASPTVLTFSRNLLVVSSIRDYYGSEFNASISQFLFGEMFPLSVDNMDIDLALQVKSGASWSNVRSSTSGTSREQISFTATSAGTYRWRVYVFSGSSQMNITFRSNIEQSVNFVTVSPTLPPTTLSPTLSPTASPTVSPTLPPTTLSPTLSPTASPTALIMFPTNLTVLAAVFKNYFGNEFNASSSQSLIGEMFPLSADNMDLDLSLQMKSGTIWTNVRSSTSSTSRELILFTTALAGTYRWRIYVYSGTSQMNLTFRSNVASSIVFSTPTFAPTLAPTTRSPTLTAAPTVFLFPLSLTVLSEKRNYLGTPFTVAASQLLTANFFPISPSNMDLDLYLELNGTSWTTVRSSASTSSTESISFTTLSSGTYRWRIYVFGSPIPGLRMNMTFRSNIQTAFT
jgi:hypothetical protein